MRSLCLAVATLAIVSQAHGKSNDLIPLIDSIFDHIHLIF